MWYKNGKIFQNEYEVRADCNASLPAVLVGFCLGYKPLKQVLPEYDKDTQHIVLDRVEEGDEEATAFYTVAQNTQEQIVQSFKSRIQALLDEKAQAKGYDSIVSACSYAGYANPFRVEGEAFGVWRANVWAYGYEQLALIEAGSRETPTVEEFLAELPTMEA